MLILGLNSHEINSSAAIVKNGKLIFAAPEERFSRSKLTKKFPINALNYFLKNLNPKKVDFDYIGQSWNPSQNLRKYNPIYSENRKSREEYFYSIPDNFLRSLNFDREFFTSRNDYTALSFNNKSLKTKFYFINHHLCHAANSYFTSEFNNAAVLTCDFKGEFETATFSKAKGNKIIKINNIEMPHSLGMFYATFTDLMGYKPDQDEWKVMAISAFKNPDKTFFKKMKSLYKLKEDGKVIFDMEFFRGNDLTNPNLYTKKLKKIFGENKNKKFSDWHISVASALQKSSEEIATHFLRYLYKQTKLSNICLGGGFFMNSVFNGKLLDNTKFKNVHIPYAPTDCGNSIGAAYYINHCIHNKNRISQKFQSQIGPNFQKQYIKNLLQKRKIKFYESKNIEKDICDLILKHGFIAHFDGKSEFGDRALGNRSILGDPRFEYIKKQINSAIKYRESYRPFAPMVTSTNIEKFFDVKKNFKSNYMEKVVKLKKKFSNKLQAVAHVDNSARVQTVDPNCKIYRILEHIEKKTGFPILLNTSLNINGEPMVLAPEDAIGTFYKSGLEILVLSDFIIKKN